MLTLNNKRVAIDITSAAKDLAHNPEQMAKLMDAISGVLLDKEGAIRQFGVLVAAKSSSRGQKFVEILGETAKGRK